MWVPDQSHEKWLSGQKTVCYRSPETKNCIAGSRGQKHGCLTELMKNDSSAKKPCAIGHQRPKTALPALVAENMGAVPES